MYAFKDKLERLVKKQLDGFNLILWGVEFVAKDCLRIYIDTRKFDGAITVDDCANVSNFLSKIFLVELPEAELYDLEISSPGLDRKFFKLEQYKYFVGKFLAVQTFNPLHFDNDNEDNGRRKFTGILESVQDDGFKLFANNIVFKINFDNVKNAKIKNN